MRLRTRNIPPLRLRQFPMLDMNSSYLHVLNRICEDVQQEMGPKLKENEIEWTVNAEVLFFYSLIGHKPVGVNRHFMMLLIHNKFSVYLNHQISSKVLWDHLDSMYDMAALHESEIIPFPNEEVDFELPEDCHELLRTKHGVSLKKSDSDNELNKGNANNVKASKKIAPKIKQSNTPVSTPKTTFATPVASKPLKTQTVVKTETKAPTSDATPKVSRSESGSSSKTNKIKRSSSPFATKLVKTDSASVVKEDSPDIPSSKKIKSDRSSSPAVVKKPVKTESSVTANSAKKLVKSESSGNVSKTSKTETSDNSVKKVKVDKDQVSKKGKTATPADVSTKKVKSDANGTKKRSESESSSKKSSDSSSVRQMKTEVKSSSQSSKVQETETSTPSGSRKSSPVVKAKNSDSSKKLKRHKLEESSKKSTSTPKRRRP